MFENSKKVLASADVPVIIAKTEGEIRVRNFKCKDSGINLVANYMAAPLSPISGGKLVPANNKILTLSAEDVANFTSLGTCPHCKTNLCSSREVAASLKNEKIHCIVCGEEMIVEEATTPSEYVDMIEQNIQDADEKNPKEAVAEADLPVEENRVESLPAEGIPAEEENRAEDKPEEVEAEAEEPESALITEEDGADTYVEGLEKVEAEETPNPESLENEEAPAEEPAVEDEEIRVDMLSRVQAGVNSKKIELVASRNTDLRYVMVANKPVATMHKSRASAEVKEIFSNNYLLESSLIEAVEKEGMSKAVVSAFGIVPLVLKVKASDVINKAVNDRVAEIEQDYKEKEEGLDEAYEQSLGMAAVGINRGTFADCDNVLAEDIIENLENVGVEDAREIVESSFKNRGEDYLRTIVAKAAEFKGKSAEVRNEIANTILASSFKSGLNLKHKAVASVQSVSAQPNDEDIARYKQLLQKY